MNFYLSLKMWVKIQLVGEKMRNKYSQNPFDSATKFGADSIKTASKRAIQKVSEATGDLTGNRITDKITSVSKNNLEEEEEARNETEVPKERYISPEERQQIVDE